MGLKRDLSLKEAALIVGMAAFCFVGGWCLARVLHGPYTKGDYTIARAWGGPMRILHSYAYTRDANPTLTSTVEIGPGEKSAGNGGSDCMYSVVRRGGVDLWRAVSAGTGPGITQPFSLIYRRPGAAGDADKSPCYLVVLGPEGSSGAFTYRDEDGDGLFESVTDTVQKRRAKLDNLAWTEYTTSAPLPAMEQK